MEQKAKLQIDLDYRRPADMAEAKPNSEITENYIGAAVQSAYPQGLEGQLRRIYGRLQRKLDSAIEQEESAIELEEAEKDFLRKVIDKCTIPANVAKYFLVLEEEIERATSRKAGEETATSVMTPK